MNSRGIIFPEYQKRCQPYKQKVMYPNPATCTTQIPQVSDNSPDCRPFGYQPKRPNPGGLLFYQYSYPFQTANGKPIQFPGMGWQRYYDTGKYYNWWRNGQFYQ